MSDDIYSSSAFVGFIGTALIVAVSLFTFGAKADSRESKTGLLVGGSLVSILAVVGGVMLLTKSSRNKMGSSNVEEVIVFPPPLTWEGLIKNPAEMNAILMAESEKYGPSTHVPRKSRTSRNSRKNRKDRNNSRKN